MDLPIGASRLNGLTFDSPQYDLTKDLLISRCSLNRLTLAVVISIQFSKQSPFGANTLTCSCLRLTRFVT